MLWDGHGTSVEGYDDFYVFAVASWSNSSVNIEERLVAINCARAVPKRYLISVRIFCNFSCRPNHSFPEIKATMTISSIEQKTWTILEIIPASTEYLKSKGIDDARLNAELLLAHVLGCRRIDLYAGFDKPLKDGERAHYKTLLKRRVAREPLQYIIGETEFMGLRFFVDRRVLVPRPDTEVLVERAIDLCHQFVEGIETIKVLDIGTGSGNIAVSIAKFVGNAFVPGPAVRDAVKRHKPSTGCSCVRCWRLRS